MRRRDGTVALLFIVGLCMGWLFYPAGAAAQTFKGAPSTVVIGGSGCYDFAIGSGDSRLWYRQWDCGGGSVGDVATAAAISTDGNVTSPYNSDTDTRSGHALTTSHTASCAISGDSCVGDWTLFDASGVFATSDQPSAFQMQSPAGTPAGNADNDIRIQVTGAAGDVWSTRYDVIGGNTCTAIGTGTAGFCGGNTGDPFTGDGTGTLVNTESSTANRATGSGSGRASSTVLSSTCAALSRSCVGRFVKDLP